MEGGREPGALRMAQVGPCRADVTHGSFPRSREPFVPWLPKTTGNAAPPLGLPRTTLAGALG